MTIEGTAVSPENGVRDEAHEEEEEGDCAAAVADCCHGIRVVPEPWP